MAGLEAWYEPASSSAHGDKWNTVFKTATPPTMLCCLPGAALAKATSCDPTGHTELVKMAAAYGTGDVLKSSSRTWKTPEVAILNCPIEEELCGAKKVVTVTSTKASLTMGDKSIDWTKDKTNCSWVLKSACKPIVVGYDATSTITAATKSDGVYVQWVQIPQASVTSDKVGQFTFTKAQLLSTTAAKSALYQFTQKYSSGGSTAAFTRDFPVELAALWAAQWNAQVPAYKTAVEDYDKEVKNFNLVHAQTALGKTNTKAKEELATYLTGLTTFLKTTAEPSAASTVKKLPEYPSVAVARPLAWAGPKLIAEADAAKAAVDDYYPSAMGGGKALTGILPLAADRHQGFGTNGAGKLAEVVNFSVDHMTAASVKDDTVCKDTYVGIIAVAKEAAKS